MAGDQELNCSTSSIVTTNVTIAYGVTYGLALLFVSIYSFRFLNTFNVKFSQSSFIKKVIKWTKDVWLRRRCYIPIITHLFDQITDISVAIQFYDLSITKNDNDWIACGGLNIWYLFILTILSMAIYRIISSYLIYKSTSYSLSHLVFQLLDIELFRALYINYLCNKTEPCDPQRWITAMEASLESAPQALIQMIYLVKTKTFNSSYLVFISLLSSLWSIISKLVSDDKIVVKEKAKKALFALSHDVLIDLLLLITMIIIGCIVFVIVVALSPFICCYALWDYLNDKYDCCRKHDGHSDEIGRKIKAQMILEKGTVKHEDYKLEVPALKQPTILDDGEATTVVQRSLTQQMKLANDANAINLGCCKLNPKSHYKWMQWWYMLRVVWRILDVSSRIFICTLCWIIMGGTALSIIICCEFVFVLVISYRLSQWELIFGVVALVVSTTNETVRSISWAMFVYRTITNYVLMILMTIFMAVAFECWRCPKYVDREYYLSDTSTTMFMLFIYCWCAVFINPYITMSLVNGKVFEEKASTSRDLEKMYESQNFNGIIEMQLYSGQYSYFDEPNKRSLLGLVLRQKLVPIVSFLSKKSKLPPLTELDADGKNLLDHYCTDAVWSDGHSKEYRTMTSFLLDVYKIDKTLTDSMGRNAFLCGCYNKERDIVSEFTKYEKDIVFSTDKRGRTMFHYVWNFSSFMQQFDAINFYKTYPKFIEIDGQSPFFYAAHYKKAATVQALLKLNLEFVNRKDHRSKNILDYYVSNPSLLETSDLVSIYEYNHDLSGTDGRNVFLCSVLAKDMPAVKYFMEHFPDVVHSTDRKKKNMFDFLWRHPKCMKQLDPFEFYEKHSDFMPKQSKSSFFYACYRGNGDVIQQLMMKFPELINTTDDTGYTVLDYYCSNADLLSTDSLLHIFKHSPGLTTAKQKLTVFLCCCYIGNTECVDELIQLNNEVVKETNVDGYNGSSIAKMNKKDEMVKHLADKYQIEGKLPGKLTIDTRPTNMILLGTGNCGKTTLHKQMTLRSNQTLDEERYQGIIIQNIIQRMEEMVRVIATYNQKEQTKDGNVELKLDGYSDEALNYIDLFTERDYRQEYKLTPEIAKGLKILWNESSIQKVWMRRHSLMFCNYDNYEYYMNEIDRISNVSYVPSVQDILWVYSRTGGIIRTKFEIDRKVYSVVDVGGTRAERRKWKQIFDDIAVVVFVVDISAYNLRLMEDNSINRMSDSLELFEEICQRKIWQRSEIFLFFNKIDILKDKFKTNPITVCPEFKDFDGDVESYDETLNYIRNKFKSKNTDMDRDIHTYCTNAVDVDVMTAVFDDFFPFVKRRVVTVDLKRAGFT
eukprot:57700_1